MKGGTSPGGLPTAVRKTFVCRLGVLPLPDPSLCWPLIPTPCFATEKQKQKQQDFVLRMSHPRACVFKQPLNVDGCGATATLLARRKAHTKAHTHTHWDRLNAFAFRHTQPSSPSL